MKRYFSLCSVALVATAGLNFTILPLPVQAQTVEGKFNQEVSHPLKPGDRVRLTVVGFPELSGEQVVMADGTLQLPMAGTIGVSGLTLPQATVQITDAFRPYVRYPQIGLAILNQAPLRISVTGEVLEPGPRVFVPDSDETIPTTVSGVLSLAGGITPNADLRNITIRRGIPAGDNAGLLKDTKTEISVDLWQVIQTGDLSADLRIYDGDEVVVPTTQVTNVEQQRLLASTIAPATITVQVMGEVGSPGITEVDPQAGVSAAVAAAGGLTEDASDDSIVLFRMADDGNLEQQIFSFGEASTPVLNGDLIVVEKSNRGNVSGMARFLNLLINPFTSILDVFN
ncbi:MAG: polysaccharide biosynthesis/export family protein [Cyanobacteria bacterium P01_C01_bin.118]